MSPVDPNAVDLNADVGEGYGRWSLGDDDALMRIITSANVACGFHAGDPSIIRRTCVAAVAHDVAIGAQVSYPDLAAGTSNPDQASESDATISSTPNLDADSDTTTESTSNAPSSTQQNMGDGAGIRGDYGNASQTNGLEGGPNTPQTDTELTGS